MNAFLSGLLKILAALLLACLIGVAILGAVKLYQWQPAAPAAVPAAVGLNADPAATEAPEAAPAKSPLRFKKPLAPKAGGGVCNVTAINEGEFAPESRIVGIVREFTYPNEWIYVRWFEPGQSETFGAGVLKSGGNRDGWKVVGCDLTAANTQAFVIAKRDLGGNIPGLKNSWLQLECVSAEDARAAGETVQNFPRPDGGENWFIKVHEGLNTSMLLVCDPSEGELPPAEEPGLVVPAEGEIPAGCINGKPYDAADGEDIVPAGWILEEIVYNGDGYVTLQVIYSASTRMSQYIGDVHYNYWSYCSEFAATRGWNSQQMEWRNRVVAGGMFPGYTVNSLPVAR